MIESIQIQDEASYKGKPVVLNDLSQHNFIFGANATGKTTISKIIADEAAFPHCPVTWRMGNKLETMVYNSEFVTENFEQTSELKGIFTLSKEDKDSLTKIRIAKSDLDSLVDKILILTKTLEGEDGASGKKYKLAELENDFEEKCWGLKLKHDAKLQGAFTGFRNKKSAFKKKLLAEDLSNSAQLKPLSNLEKRAETVFGKPPQAKATIALPKYDDLLTLETASILSKKIVGKTDVDIAAMIQKLGNSDWVKQGRVFYEANDKVCPFCQQNTEDSFSVSLNEYFDETFESDNKAIEQLHGDYKSRSERLTQSLKELLVSPFEFLDADKLNSDKELLEFNIRTNLQRIQKKRDEPSRSVKLDSLYSLLTSVKKVIESANIEIKDHNEMVDNLSKERRTLSAQVWKYLLELEIKGDLAKYEKEKDGLIRAIESLTSQIDEKEKAKREKETEIRRLEKTTTSIQPTIDGINSLLLSVGFRNFTLAKSGRKRYYKIVRSDGTDAKETLSEGEKNFITFLYFYHLLKGSESESGMTNDRVVVFDDPVSSLDSDILFVVSTLIKGLLEEVRMDSGYIKQIIVMTHNVYFHREVSFNNRRLNDRTMKEETFWIIRKLNDVSVLTRYETNPIKTSYELLWMEVRKKDRSNLGIQNTLRRILENYFTILGNVNPDTIYSHFEGEEKKICRSLFSWVNAGSHHAFYDIDINDSAPVETFLAVFRKIFKETDHYAHYKMMMGEYLQEEEES